MGTFEFGTRLRVLPSHGRPQLLFRVEFGVAPFHQRVPFGLLFCRLDLFLSFAHPSLLLPRLGGVSQHPRPLRRGRPFPSPFPLVKGFRAMPDLARRVGHAFEPLRLGGPNGGLAADADIARRFGSREPEPRRCKIVRFFAHRSILR
jgi:hypothetical protein